MLALAAAAVTMAFGNCSACRHEQTEPRAVLLLNWIGGCCTLATKQKKNSGLVDMQQQQVRIAVAVAAVPYWSTLSLKH